MVKLKVINEQGYPAYGEGRIAMGATFVENSSNNALIRIINRRIASVTGQIELLVNLRNSRPSLLIVCIL